MGQGVEMQRLQELLSWSMRPIGFVASSYSFEKNANSNMELSQRCRGSRRIG